MTSSPKIKITIKTLIGIDEEIDRMFLEYLDQYSITHTVLGEISPGGTEVEYEGGAIALRSMLLERFGYEIDEVREILRQDSRD